MKHSQPVACSLPCSHSDSGLWKSALVRKAPQVTLRAGGDAQAAALHHQNCCRDRSRDGHSHLATTLATGRVRHIFPDPQDTDRAVNAQVERMLTNVCPCHYLK